MLMRTVCFLVVLGMAARPLASQTPCNAACNQFISSVNFALSNLTSGLPSSTPIVLGGNLVFANGQVVGGGNLNVLLSYVDGLKAAGAQRIDLNPGVTSVTNPAIQANYAAVVQHARQLGLQIAINPEISPGELGTNPTFQAFESMAMTTYAQLAQLYQPDNFVIVHEPTTAEGSMHLTPGQQDWAGFINAVGPAIKAVSPHTRLGAGGFQNGAAANLSTIENTYWQQFVTLPTLDFMTMDIYNDDTFPVYENWIQLANTNHKGIYIEETWAPHYLPVPLPKSAFSAKGTLTKSLDSLSLIGSCDAVFANMDVAWLQGLARWASARGMEAMTAFTTLALFALESGTNAYLFSPMEGQAVQAALANGQLNSITGEAFQRLAQQMGIKVATSLSSASYAQLSSAFCGTANPCNPNSSVAPDELVSAFGVDLATTSASDGSFPTTLGGTSMTLVDSSNHPYDVQMYAVAGPPYTQINYLVPSGVPPGPATITVHSADGTVSTGIVLVQPVMPGIFTANTNGQGAAAAIAIVVHADGTRSMPYTFNYPCAAGSCLPQSLHLAATDQLYIEFYGTGIRQVASLAGVTATVNGQNVPVLYAGPSSYIGLDQVNIQIPQSLFGSGTVNVVLTVQDPVTKVPLASNTVTLLI